MNSEQLHSQAASAFPTRRPRRWTAGTVVLLLAAHAGLLAYSATRHSPTILEPKSLVAGLSHWEFGRFDAFKVNPPLVRMVAALPVMAVGYNEKWNNYAVGAGQNSGHAAGEDFIDVNGERSFRLVTLARWACIPFSVAGGLFCFLWAKELAGSDAAGLIALFLWCFEPNILAHGELVTSDGAAASFGVAAGYGFWRWLRAPSWSTAAGAGGLLGLAGLTKLSWIILFGLWPLLWILWQLGPSRRPAIRRQAAQLGFIVLLAMYAINVVYAFDGAFTRLGDYQFISQSLSGLQKRRELGNRFTGTWLGAVPVPLPKPYIEGIDIQKADFEHYPMKSYLRGEWKEGGWWYYYLYGLWVKVPHGTQALFVLAVVITSLRLSPWRPAWLGRLSPPDSNWLDLTVVLAPSLLLIGLVSSQLEFNIHFRYVLPAFGFLFVFIGVALGGILAKPVPEGTSRLLQQSRAPAGG